MKNTLGLLGVSSLFWTTFVAAVPLDKRDYVYKTVTHEVVVTVDVTTTVTVTGKGTGAAGTPPTTATTETVPTAPTTTTTTEAVPTAPALEEAHVNNEQPEDVYSPPPTTTTTTTDAPPAPVTTSSSSSTSSSVVAPLPVADAQTTAVYSPPVEPTTSLVEPAPTQYPDVTGQSTSGGSYVGELTLYDSVPDSPLACGNLMDSNTQDFVALSVHMMGPMSNGGSGNGDQGPAHLLNPYCNKRVRITYQGKTIEAPVLDKCGGCAYPDVDLSRHLFISSGFPEKEGRLEGAVWELLD